MILLRAVALGALLLPLAGGASAGEHLSLRGDVTAQRDVLTFGDLVQDAPASLAATPIFRAPSLGQTGTIQTRRILDAAEALGLGIDTGGRLQITVTRAARRVGPGEIETVLKKALEAQAGLDPRWTGINFDGAAPILVLGPDIAGDPVASDVSYDARTRRLAATVWIGPSQSERRAAIRVAGTVLDLVEVAVLARGLERGETVRPGDINLERRSRDSVPAEALLDGGPLPGRVARRSLVPGGLVRTGDLVRPEMIARGDIVTVTYEVPGMALSMRAKATEAGSLGDTISVVNQGSKKVLQAVVVGQGRVTVGAPSPARVVASATTPVQP